MAPKFAWYPLKLSSGSSRKESRHDQLFAHMGQVLKVGTVFVFISLLPAL